MEDALYLAVTGNADINTTDGMCTAAMMLHAVLLWTYTSLYSAVRVCTAFHAAVGVDAAFLLLLVYVLTFTLLLG